MSIITVVTDHHETASLVRWSFQLARAKECDLIIIRADEKNGSEECLDVNPELIDKDPLLVEIQKTLKAEIHKANDISRTPHYSYHCPDKISSSLLDTPEITIKKLSCRNLAKVIIRKTHKEKPELLVLGRHEQHKGIRHFTDILFEDAPCSTMIIRLGSAELTNCGNLLVPCSGGPHCREALINMNPLSKAQGTIITPLLIEPPTSDLMEEVGKHTLLDFIKNTGIEQTNSLRPRVELAEDVQEGINRVASEGCDMLVIGASGSGNLRQKLFGSLPHTLMQKNSDLSIAIYRSRKKKWEILLNRLEYLCNIAIPQLDREARIALYENLHMNSTWNFDFLSLICLSTAIATLGLISNSAAVVIGAMRIAPLMTPILASGLAIVQGNLPLILNASKSIILGFISALAIGFLCGIITPWEQLTSEILSRGTPKLADMFIAFVSGVAAAHCLSRTKLSAGLPGVAIAAALVPPIASTGIALSHGDVSTAQGAAVLFLTNVVCIILGSALTFFAAGIRPKKSTTKKDWVQRALIGLVLGLTLLMIPLSSKLTALITSKISTSKLLSYSEIKEHSMPILEKFGIIEIDKKVTYSESNDGTLNITLNVLSSKIPEKQTVLSLEERLKEKFKREINIRLITMLIVE